MESGSGKEQAVSRIDAGAGVFGRVGIVHCALRGGKRGHGAAAASCATGRLF